ncbi:MAG: class I cytochrome c [Gammaproteobacteria bacterium]|nr:MAG: class I cytochrome c [Gammaproteobacteria bacterium]TND04321.1 MAG: class I cytochrome c [Gammaproteobacteria bacterium]
MKRFISVAGIALSGSLLVSTSAFAALDQAAGLELAKKSGCLACHSIEKKVVGPAWGDVSAKYKGDATKRDQLVAKVKAGGKGNWTEVTGGVPMPPYSPRVADADIEQLVDFVLSLAK